MEFLPDGELHYHIDVDGRDNVIRLIYRLDGDILHTENPAAPHSMCVQVVQGAGGALVLDFAGPKALLIRELTSR